MKKLKLIATVSLFAFLLIACNSDDGDETVPEEDDSVTEENQEDTEEDNETNGNDESSETDGSNTDNTSDNGEAAGEGEVLNLGETGLIETNYGDFEVTFESFAFLDELDGETPSSGVFVLMDATIENVGDQEITGDDLYTTTLFTSDGLSTENSFHINNINRIEDTLEPGDSTEGQFIFNTERSASYELVYNFAMSAVATQITWEFTADEASNE